MGMQFTPLGDVATFDTETKKTTFCAALLRARQAVALGVLTSGCASVNECFRHLRITRARGTAE